MVHLRRGYTFSSNVITQNLLKFFSEPTIQNDGNSLKLNIILENIQIKKEKIVTNLW